MSTFDLDAAVDRCRIDDPKGFRLQDHQTDWCGDWDIPKGKQKDKAKDLLEKEVALLAERQELLYAADSWSLLVIFQAMDAAGKDSAIKHVMSGVNPQGCQVTSFKHPSAEELDHDYLWRCNKALPERGRIGIFNRSYYEEVLVVRVHPNLAEAQRIPGAKINAEFWKKRYEDISAYERRLTRNGTAIIKFFLNVSREEQRQRLLERLEDPQKNWKFSFGDLGERNLWGEYMSAYEDAIRGTSTSAAPWFVVPADHKWFTRLVVARAVNRAIEGMKLAWPELPEEEKARLNEAKAALQREQGEKEKT